MMGRYFAKPDQTYEDHVEMAYFAWKQTIAAKMPLIERMSKRYNFSIERFLQGSLMTVALHDVGKMLNCFQEMMEKVRLGKRFDYNKNYRHELASFVWVFLASFSLNKTDLYSEWPVEALAVAGHHKPLDTDLTRFEREIRYAKRPELLKEGVEQALVLAADLFGREGWKFSELPIKAINTNGIKELTKLINGVLPKLVEREPGDRARILYVLSKGILHYADWHGSAGTMVDYCIKEDPKLIIQSLANRCAEKGISFQGLRTFQQEVAKQSGHVIAVAPTGSGKTEAALLWALKNTEEMVSAKIVYLLPTMATANSLWERITQFFGEGRVGLTHSSANLIFDKEDESGLDMDKTARNYLFDQGFIRPVTVGTVDQLLTTGFNSGRWVLKEVNVVNAVVILDEIHAYDGWTLGLLMATIKHFAALGTRFLLMSATMPENLHNLLQSYLPDAKVVKDTELLAAERSKYYVVDKTIEQNLEDIETAVQRGRRVLVVVNTVDKCQKLARELKHLDPVCYHSRFILKDRKRIEAKLEASNLVIATQIVEVALDIDFDWLFTECAPPDAIAQRAGRINRYRDIHRDSRVFIYRPDDKAKKIYEPLNDPTLLTRSFRAFAEAPEKMTEMDLLDVIGKVYTGIALEGQEGFSEALEQYGKSQAIRFNILDDRNREEDQLERTRLSKYESISVIPNSFYSEIQEVKPHLRQWYEVKIPYWYFCKHNRTKDGLAFCDMVYDEQLGALLETDERSEFL